MLEGFTECGSLVSIDEDDVAGDDTDMPALEEDSNEERKMEEVD